MSQPVWTLSVDLQTKTATFTSGLADAAKSARGSFNEIKSGAAEMGGSVGASTTEARHGVMLLAEEFNVHLPRGVTTFLASLGPVGAAMEAAFPFLAIAMGAGIIIEKLHKMGEEAAVNGQKWTEISNDIAKWGETSKKQLLDVAIEIDRLNGDKLKELDDTLKKIDLETMDHLKGEFDGVGKKADEAMTKMRSGWLATHLGMDNGVAGIQQKFEAAMDKINADMAKGDHKQLAADLKQASDQMWNLAAPTYDLAQRLREAHNEAGAVKVESAEWYQLALRNHGFFEAQTKELAAQLEIEKQKAQVAERTITPIHNATDPRVAEERQKQIAEYLKMNRDKAASDAELESQRASMEAAMTKYFETEHNKQVEDAIRAAQKEHDEAVHAAEETAKDVESARRIAQASLSGNASAGVISKLQEQEQIRKALQDELRDLQTAHQAEIAEEQAYITKMSALANSSTDPKQKEQATLDAAGAQDRLNASTRQFNEEVNRINIAMQASEQDTARMQNSWRAWFMEATKDSQSLAALMRGELQSSIMSMTNAFSSGIAKSLVEGKNFSKEMRSAIVNLSEDAIRATVEWGMKDIVMKELSKIAAAHLAGANMTASMAMAPFPLNMSAPAQGAAAAGMALAMEAGGVVPGVGVGDIVPAMLEPGEGVLSKKMMENLKSASSSGPSSTHVTHVHIHGSTIHALDSEGFSRVLDKHEDTLRQKFESHLRRMNR